jgi:hypothetical protein
MNSIIRKVKNILIVFTVISISSSAQSTSSGTKKELIVDWKVKPIQTKRNLLSLSDNPLIYNKNGIEYYVNYTNELNCLNFYDLKSSSFSYKITFFNSGPNKVFGFSRASFWGDAIVCQLTDKIQIVNFKGEVVKTLSMNDIHSKLDNEYSLKGDERLINSNFKRLYVDELAQSIVLRLYNKEDGYKDIYKNPTFLEYNLATGVASAHSVIFPNEVKKRFYGMLEYPNIISKGDSIVYNFPFKAAVYIYNKKTRQTQVKEFKVNHIPTVVKGYDLTKKDDFTITRPLFDGDVYHQIDYDPHRKLYYMLYSKAKVDDNPRERYLLVLNKKFELIGEVAIPTGLSARYAISKQGLLFRNVKEDSFDTLTLQILNIEVK